MKTKLYSFFFFIISGFLFAQVDVQYELKEIQFVGNDAFSSSILKPLLQSKETPSWLLQNLNKISSIGGKPVYFDSLLIPNDIATLRGFYQSKGFFKVKIKSQYEIDTAGRDAVLTYHIEESQPAYFSSFIVRGLEWIAPSFQETLSEYTHADTTAVYEDVIVEDKKNFILNFLRNHGYMLIIVDRPTVTIDTMKNRVDVELKFNTGLRYKIGEIFATRTGKGAELVGDDLLKEIVGLTPGFWYSNYDIQRGQVRLFRTNLFTSASVNAIIADTVGNVVPVNISGDIGLMHELSPEIIINNEDNTFNLGLGLNLSKKNFLGDARKITVGTSVAAQNLSEFIKNPSFADSTFYGYADARITIEQPFLFGELINTKFETYLTTQKRKNEYNSNLYGFKFSLDFELPQNTYLNSFNTYFNIERSEYTYKPEYMKNLLSLFFQRYDMPKVTADSMATLEVNAAPKEAFIFQSTNAILGMNIGANKTNDPFFPSTGYTLALQVEDGNSIPYLISRLVKATFNSPLSIKSVFTSTIYLPFYSSNQNSFGLKFKVGNIYTYNGDKFDIPLNQRLYAGGSNSVRGWASRQLVPAFSESNLGSNPSREDIEAVFTKGAELGGFFQMEGSVETRNRLLGRFGAALFIDYGNTWNSPGEFRFDQVAVAAGLGFRYYSDFAPFRIDFGFKVYDPKDQRPISQKQFWRDLLQFHIGIGEAF